MPIHMRPIDEIYNEATGPHFFYFDFWNKDFCWSDRKQIDRVIEFCQKHNIEFELAAPHSQSGYLEGGPIRLCFKFYQYDDPLVKFLDDHFQNPDGSPKYPDCRFLYVNAPHYQAAE